jgi:LacI family transcriptional regulator
MPIPTQGTRARLADVAREAGVSKATVSKILNGNADLSVRPATRERILEAVTRLGYRPHVGARALAGATAGALALLVPALTNPTYVTIARGAHQRARELGYFSLLSEDFGDQEADSSFNELVEAGRVDGLLIASARPGHRLVSALAGVAIPIPHVFLNRAVADSGRNVVMDVSQSSVMALDHLHELGHRAVAHVAGPKGINPSDVREQAFRRHAASLGMSVRVARGEFSESGGHGGATRLLRDRGVTAIYASSLAQSIGVLRAVQDHGLRVPEDISVVGNDDFPVAEFLSPPLTTIAMPLWELGACGVDALVAQLGGEPPRDIVVPTQPQLTRRASTAPPGGP